MARIGMGKGGKVGREILVLKRNALPEMLPQHPVSAIAREAAALEIISRCPQLPVGEPAFVSLGQGLPVDIGRQDRRASIRQRRLEVIDRKSTRLNSSH